MNRQQRRALARTSAASARAEQRRRIDAVRAEQERRRALELRFGGIIDEGLQ